MRSSVITETIKPISPDAHCDMCIYHSNAFCHLPEDTLRTFYEISIQEEFDEGEYLFFEGQKPEGVYVLCSGRAKFLIGSNKGKSLMRIALPGEILGLNAVMSGKPYEGSAEMLNSGRVRFIRHDAFMNFLLENGPASFRAAEFISRDYFAVHEQIRSLALSSSVIEKLAKLLLHLCETDADETADGTHLKISLTHEEIAQMIGTSRETVTRILSDLKSRRIINGNGSGFIIHDKIALVNLIDN